MLPAHSAHDEPMMVKRFVLHLHIFHLYLIINKNAEKGMCLVIQERFSSNIWYVTIFCEYPVSLKLLLNILYPGIFFREYPVSRKHLMGPQLCDDTVENFVIDHSSSDDGVLALAQGRKACKS